MIHRPFLVATILIAVGVGGWQSGIHSQSSTLDQSLPSAERSRAFRTSTGAGLQITTFMTMLGAASGLPIVFEVDPGHSRIEQDFSVANHTARETLDAFVQLHPSYLWRELEDVVVVRPQSAWVNADHPFNRRGVAVRWTNVTARDVLDNVVALLVGPGATHDGSARRDPRTFSISVQGGSLLEVFMKAAKARGDLVWFIGSMGPSIIGYGPEDALGFLAMSPDGQPDPMDPIGGIRGLQEILKWNRR
jgi:hypothetical protein